MNKALLRFIQKNGRQFKMRSFSENAEVRTCISSIKTFRQWKRPKFASRQCFTNALIISLYTRSIIKYVEGYIIRDGAKIHHAWNYWPEENFAFDVTYEIFGGLNPRDEYFGVVLDRGDLLKVDISPDRSPLQMVYQLKDTSTE